MTYICILFIDNFKIYRISIFKPIGLNNDLSNTLYMLSIYNTS